MKVRIRNRKITKNLEVDNSCRLNDLHQFVYGLFENSLPSEFFFSLNGTDPIVGTGESSDNDISLQDCNIVGGDLILVVSLNPEEETEKLNKQDSPKNVPDDKNVAMETDELRSRNSESSENLPSTSGATDLLPMEEEPVDRDIVNKCLSEPLLCRDCIQGRVPPLLVKVYQESNITSIPEALVLALHILMLESGYVPVQASSDSEAQSSDLMNEDWRSGGSYKLRYTHKSCSPTDIFTLVCVTMKKMLIVHGLSPDKEDKKCQLNTDSSEYIQSVNCETCDVYRNLSKLSMLFKDAVSLPLLQTFRQNHGYPVFNGIMSLSHEVKLTVMRYLDVSSTIKMASVCKDFLQIAKDRYLWRRLYLRDFGNRQNNDFAQDWYTIYKLEYKLRKQRERDRRKFLSHMTCVVPPVFRPSPDPGYPAPFPLYPPGVIGGDFDLFPQFQGPSYRRSGTNPLQPLQPRFDPLGPSPDHNFRPGRYGGLRDPRGMFGRTGGPRFF